METDKELQVLSIQLPEKWLEKIMNQYMAFVYTIVFSKLSTLCNKQDIEECVSDIFYEIYRTRNCIDLEKGTLKSYVTTLSKRRAIDTYRKHVKRSDFLEVDSVEHCMAQNDASVEDVIIENEASNSLISAIKALGEPDSGIIIRRYYLSQSTKQISKALGIKANTVDKKVSRALVKLQQVLGGAY